MHNAEFIEFPLYGADGSRKGTCGLPVWLFGGEVNEPLLHQVTVALIPIVALTVLILVLNVVAPSSADVRVFKYTVPIVSQVRGRVIEVPVEEGNRLVKKGDVLFRVDPTPYQLTVNSLKAQLVGAEGGREQLREQLKSATGATAAKSLGASQAKRYIMSPPLDMPVA